MQLRFWAATDTGRVRDHNEDNFLVDQNLQLFVVCDGMGGHAAGEVASAVCVRTVRDVIAAEQDLLERLRDHPTDDVAVEKLKQLLRHSVQTACRRIWEMAQKDQSRRGMGTTCVALVLVGERGFVGHVGDSRMYRIRAGDIDQITDDHSLLNEMIRQGKVAPGTSEAEFPHKNAVTRAVGVRETVDVDAFGFELESGDRLVMCSDGLSEYFDGSVDLVRLMGSDEPEATTTRCIDFANESGGKDNITVVVIDCDPVAEDAAGGPGRAEVIEILRTTPYFHYLAPPELEQIRQLATRVDYEADEAVVADDEDNDRLYLILKGSVSLQLDGEQVSVLTTGEHFGEMALIDAQDEKDTNLVARTVEPSIFLTVERDQFVRLLRAESGLAIKLLWNFVQVFADRLQSVPPEYRYTPDEWRSDPDAIADVTPPSGTLVFEEDLQRSKEGESVEESAADADEITVKGPPELPPGAGGDASPPSRPPTSEETTEGVVVSVDDDEDGDHRDTVELASVSRDGMDTIPPGADLEELNDGQTVDDGDDDETPSVEFNPPTARREPSDPSVDAGLSSGTYDQSLLEARGGGDSTPGGEAQGGATTAGESPDESSTEDQTVTINRRASTPGQEGNTSTVTADEAASTPEKSKEPGRQESKAAMKKTMKLNWNAEGESIPPEFNAETPDDAAGADDDNGRPVPSADILRKAARQSGDSPPGGAALDDGRRDSETSSESTGDDNEDRRTAISGQTKAAEDGEATEPSPDEPKVMISSDLAADVGEET